MPLRIRTFRDGDLDQVMAIENDSFPDPYNKQTFQLLMRWVGERFIVAEDGGILGYAISETQGTHGHIISIAVLPKNRRSGVGAALLQELISRMEPNVQSLYLEVRAGNSEAIRMYEKFSFKKTGEVRSRYYPDGEDAIVMARERT